MSYIETMCGLAADKKRIKAAGEELTRELAVKSVEEKVRDAAPEMLSMLKELAQEMTCVCHLLKHIGDESLCSTCRLLALIAKAEGR